MTITNQVHDVTDQMADKVHSAIDKTAAGLAQTEEFIRKEAAIASEKTHQGIHCAQVKSEDLVRTVSGYVRDNPVMSLGIAFIAGSLISSFIRRR